MYKEKLFANTSIMNKITIHPLKELTKNYIRCGVMGWCLEIVFTSLTQSPKYNPSLMGKTSLLMFPIYGAACLFKPIYPLVQNKTWPLRGLFYMTMIFIMEYLSGLFLMKHNRCPWDYSAAKYNYKKVIRLDYAPCWFCTGLIYEWLLLKK